MDDRLRAAFDADAFRSMGHAAIDVLASYLGRAVARAEMPVLPLTPPEDALRDWPSRFDAPQPEEAMAVLERVVHASNHLHHPRFVGHQVTAPLPMAALFELTAALLNNGTAVYEMGPVSTAMERTLAKWLGAQLGYPSSCDAVFTSGGSAGNLTALLAARQARAGFDSWSGGAHSGPPLAVLASEQTHYCIKRSTQIMGWGEDGVIPVPVDARFRMRPDALADALVAAEQRGRRVIAVVASAGSTSTGAFDPLEPIASFCEAHGLWFHVDGAHGASVALSPKLRGQLAGVERADSVVWDMHKMMLMPALATAVVFRDGARSYEAFSQDAAYLFAGKTPEEEWFNGAVRTLECTKRMMSVPIYAALTTYGAGFFGDYVTRMIELARRFAAMLRATPGFEVAVEPDCNIVCFRFLGDARDGLDELQVRIRERILASGRFYLVQTRLPRGVYLRVTLINALTTEADLAELLDAIREVAG